MIASRTAIASVPRCANGWLSENSSSPPRPPSRARRGEASGRAAVRRKAARPVNGLLAAALSLAAASLALSAASPSAFLAVGRATQSSTKASRGPCFKGGGFSAQQPGQGAATKRSTSTRGGSAGQKVSARAVPGENEAAATAASSKRRGCQDIESAFVAVTAHSDQLSHRLHPSAPECG